MSLPLSFWKGSVFIFYNIKWPVSPAIAPNWSPAEGVYNPQCLSVAIKLMHIGVVMCASPLPVTPEKLFQGVLAQMFT